MQKPFKTSCTIKITYADYCSKGWYFTNKNSFCRDASTKRVVKHLQDINNLYGTDYHKTITIICIILFYCVLNYFLPKTKNF